MREEIAMMYRQALGLIYSYRRLSRLKRKLLRRVGVEHRETADYVPRTDIGAGFFAPFHRIVEVLPTYERGVLLYLRNLFGRGSCLFLDIGAYVGEYSVLAAKAGCDVIAFEPNPISLTFLRRNVEGAGVESRVRAVGKGLWDEEGTLPLKLEHSVSRFVQSCDASGGGSKEIPVEVTTLDRVYGENERLFEGKNVIMKIDVEGAGLRVVRGGLRLIERVRPHVVFEIHRREEDELAAVPYFLRLGYRWRPLEHRFARNFMIALEPP